MAEIGCGLIDVFILLKNQLLARTKHLYVWYHTYICLCVQVAGLVIKYNMLYGINAIETISK